MKKIGIAVTDPHDWTAAALCNAVRKRGMEPFNFSFGSATSDISSGRIVVDGVEITSLDAVIVRDLGPAARNGAVFRFDILTQLEEMGIPVVNSPQAIACCANKYVSSALLAKNSIPTPKTIVTDSLEGAVDALSCFKRAVVKPVFGYKGIGVECVRNDESGMRKLRKIIEKDGVVYIQEFIPNQGRDIRVFVVDNRVLGAIYRAAPEGGWINNLSQGGRPGFCSLTEEQEALSLKAAKVAGAVFAGVDIIEGDRSYVLEINGTPSGKGIFESCRVDVAPAIAEYVCGMV
ncbi:MAG: RimK family alpha-L-glutamate ligase [Candidatus Methanoperedens sp.]|nr:RimK family alpha-L-glutamate ligase [Candidatus Methanoperedens sp.]